VVLQCVMAVDNLLSLRTAGITLGFSELNLTSLFASIRLELYDYIGSRNFSCLLLSLSLLCPSILDWRHSSLPGGQLSPWCQLCYTVYLKSDSLCCKVRLPLFSGRESFGQAGMKCSEFVLCNVRALYTARECALQRPSKATLARRPH